MPYIKQTRLHSRPKIAGVISVKRDAKYGDGLSSRIIKQANAAMQHYQETGLHLNFEEMDTWLYAWTTDTP